MNLKEYKVDQCVDRHLLSAIAQYIFQHKHGNVYIFVIRNKRVSFRQLEKLHIPHKKSSIFQFLSSIIQSKIEILPGVPKKTLDV